MKLAGLWIAVGACAALTACSHTGSVGDDGTSEVYAGDVIPTQSSLPPVYTPPGATTPPPVPTTTEAEPVAKIRLNADGQGIKTTKTFKVAVSEWLLQYSFNCGDSTGNFGVFLYRSDGTLVNVAVNELDYKNTDETYLHGAGRYYLTINSSCNWKVRVTG